MALAAEIYLERIQGILTSILNNMSPIQSTSFSTITDVKTPTYVGVNGSIEIDEQKLSKDRIKTIITVDLSYELKYEEETQ